MTVRFWNHVSVVVQSRFRACVPQLLLSDLGRNAEIVQERRVNVAELVPCHPTKLRSFGAGSKYSL